jgi:hypothetical protein
MSTYIVASGHMPVVSAINHLHVGVTWRNIDAYTVRKIHTLWCV